MKIENRFSVVGAILVCAALCVLSGCDRSSNVADAPSAKPPTVGTQVDDTIVTARVKSALLSDREIKSSDIKVETNKGEVTLSGFVDNQDQVNRSIAAAKGVEGAKDVNSVLALKNGKSTIGNKIDDSVITAKVKSALINAADLKSRDIMVATNKGDVQLSGVVDNTNQISRAVEIAKSVEGVTSVNNELSVRK